MCQRKTADKHALQAFKETCDEAATELPPGWKNAFQLFCADSSETTSHGARWAAFKADNGGTGGEYDEMARVARLEYLQAHAEALERFHSSTTSVPAWERAQQLRDADAGGGGGGGGGGGRSSGVGDASGAGGAGGLQPPTAAAAPGKKTSGERRAEAWRRCARTPRRKGRCCASGAEPRFWRRTCRRTSGSARGSRKFLLLFVVASK